MLENLANSRYLMSAYARSSDSWENFRLTGRQSSLHEVAFALCGAWTLLSEDDDFLEGLSEVPAQVASMMYPATAASPEERARADEFREHLAVDRLLARELVILADAGMDPRHAVRLVTDLGDLLTEEIDQDRVGEHVSVLRNEVGQIAQVLCEAESRLRALDYEPATEVAAGRPPHRTWVRGLKTVGKALAATAGVAGAAANVAASVASFGIVSGLGLASVVGGAQATSVAIRSMRVRD
jgi:hypothetical protein